MTSPVLVVMPAAGDGTRYTIEAPKPLALVGGIPLCRYALDALPGCDVVMVIKTEHRIAFENVLNARTVSFRIQERASGMGDAVLTTVDLWSAYEKIVVVWSDVVWLTRARAAALLCTDVSADVIVPATRATAPYVGLRLGPNDEIEEVFEKREAADSAATNVSDLGVFILRPAVAPLFEKYLEDGGASVGRRTGERNFLPFLAWLHRAGSPARAVLLDGDLGVVAINSHEDAERFLGQQTAGR